MLGHIAPQNWERRTNGRRGVILNEVKKLTQISLITQSEQRILGFDCEVPRSLRMAI
jgi:hypothetical protein